MLGHEPGDCEEREELSPDVVAGPGTHVCRCAGSEVEVCTRGLVDPGRCDGVESLVLQAAAGEVKGCRAGGEEVCVGIVEGEGVDDLENDVHGCCGSRGVVGKEMSMVPTRRVDGGSVEARQTQWVF